MENFDITHTNAADDNSTAFQKLPNFFKKNGWNYNLVERIGDVAIFSQESEGKICYYEVFEIRKQKAAEFNGIKYEAKEKPPSNEEWGTNAFTVYTLEQAKVRMNEIQNRINLRNHE